MGWAIMFRNILILWAFAALSACSTPIGRANAPLSTYDRDTEFNITESDGGFAITVYYSRYQFIPEGDTVAEACRQQMYSIAYEHAESLGRDIQPINEQRTRLSMGRNGLTGVSSCQAHTIVEWAE
jgi:hypothetical protein